jgi:hypothetical protein
MESMTYFDHTLLLKEPHPATPLPAPLHSHPCPKFLKYTLLDFIFRSYALCLIKEEWKRQKDRKKETYRERAG